MNPRRTLIETAVCALLLALVGGCSASDPVLPDDLDPVVCDRHATDPDTLATELAAATSGQTICLAAGDYGTFTGADRANPVTLAAEPDAEVTLNIAFDGARNLTVRGMTIGELDLRGSRDITIAHNRFTGQAVVHAGAIADANLLFDDNTHVDIPTCDGCFAGRLHIDPEGTEDTGVTIRNSLFDGSYSDGVRADANGIVIEGNEFRNLEDRDPFHTDPIQIYGGQRITIRGNFFHDNAVAAHIGGWDGNDHNVVEDNVFVGGPTNGEAIAMSSDVGSVIRHNTLVQGQCNYGWHCGIVLIDHKTGDDPSTGTVVQDNILSEITDTDATDTTIDHNLMTDDETPVYVGPTTTYEGYRLAEGSPGVGAASDGSNVGIR